GNIVHLTGTDLHLYLASLPGDYGRMQRLIAVGFGYRNKIAKPLGDGGIPVGDYRVNTPAVLFGMWIFKDNANGKKIIDLLKRFLLALHFPKDRIDMFRPAFDLECKTLVSQLFAYRLHKFFNKF